MRTLTFVALTGFGALICADARASGFMVRENSATTVGTMYAGNGSRADAPETAFNNPAGLTRLTESQIEFGSTVILPSIQFRGGASVLNTPIVGNDGGNSGQTAVVPNLYWVFAFSDKLKAGVAVTVPFGNGIKYDPGWSGRYLGIKTQALSADVNPNIAYKLNDMFSVGGGVSAQYLKIDVSSAVPQFVIFGPAAGDGFYEFKADDWAFGYNVGALADLGGGTRVGLTYRSKIDHRIEGSLDFMETSPLLGLVSGSAHADVHLPGTAGLSVTDDLASNFSLSADMQFTGWSVFNKVIIESQNPPFSNDEGFRDSWMISFGGVYRADDRWTLRSGVAWDQTPVTDRFRAVSLPDHDRYMMGVGFGYKLTDSISLDGAYAHSFAWPHATMNSSVNNTDQITHAVVLNGIYDVAVDILSFSVGYKL